MRTWVHRTTVKTVCDLQKGGVHGIADSMYECIAAWRYFEAIESWLAGDEVKAHDIAAKVRVDKFHDTDLLLRVQQRISTTYRQEDPFTDTRVAAHQQRADWRKLSTGQHTPEQLERIKKRHEAYRQCQPELQPKEHEHG